AIGQKPQLAFAFEKSYKMLALIGLPLAVGIGVMAFPLMRLLGPDGHLDPSIPALQVLAPSVVLLFVNNAFIYTLTAIDRQADFTRLALVTLAVNVGLNLVLIPAYGLIGAAIASTLTELALFAGGWWLLRQQQLRLGVLSSIGRVALSAAAMGAVVYLVRSWALILVALVGVAVYALALFAFRALSAEEWAIVRSGLMAR
ncbi:MAG TPA: polysaccharide biosynthesis C-terminal domain-containing protein, partial [Candidatus Dormibacteraeota bacterium]|nr:polysaccharide biosynthesis C-terminal domain-containing protein [Candidatus Dormibacteraeota bacterium]